MAKLTFIDINDGEYTVQRDDGSMYKRFDNFEEAKSYEAYLQQLDNQSKVVKQNDEIIANQKRLIEVQERNNRMPQRPPMPQVTRQILDPEYKEWLRFQKETNPEYLKWKKEKEEEKAREEARAEAERIQREVEKAAQEALRVKEKEEAEKRLREQRENEAKEKRRKILESIAPFETAILEGKDLPAKERNQAARYTENKEVINILKEIYNERTLMYLYDNEFVSKEDKEYIRTRKNAIIKVKKLKTSKAENATQGGCLSTLLLLIIPSFIISLVILL